MSHGRRMEAGSPLKLRMEIHSINTRNGDVVASWIDLSNMLRKKV